MPVKRTNEQFIEELKQKRDQELRKYCNQRTINLLEIKYTDIKNIDSILDNFILNLQERSRYD